MPAQVVEPSQAPPDPVRTCFLYGAKELAFVNRHQFRDALESLESGGVKIVVVDGPECSGKTYSLNLVSYLADTERRFRPVYVICGPYISLFSSCRRISPW